MFKLYPVFEENTQIFTEIDSGPLNDTYVMRVTVMQEIFMTSPAHIEDVCEKRVALANTII